MKRLLLVITAILLMANQVCLADESEGGFCGDLKITPYIGGDLVYKTLKVKQNVHEFKHERPNANLYAGVKIGDFAGLEVGSLFAMKPHKPEQLKPFNKSVHATAMGFLPYNNIELFVGLGISYYNYPLKRGVIRTNLVKKSVPRLICGAQYALMDNMKFRTSLSVDHMKKLKHPTYHAKDCVQVGAGLQYSF